MFNPSATVILSIVVVAYKSQDEITGCLASLPRTIDGRVVEVIVIDNSPHDGIEEIVRAQFPWVDYVALETNVGFGRGNNLGYARTNPASEFVLFLNPDTVCNAAALAHCVARLNSDRSIGLISPKLVLADGSMDLACRRSIPTLWDGFCRASGLASAFFETALFSGYNLTHLPPDGTYEVGAINGAFMLGRRAVFETVGRAGPLNPKKRMASSAAGGPALPSERSSAVTGRPIAQGLPPAASSSPHVFDESFFMYGDDLDLCIRVRRAGWKIVYDGSVSIRHLKGVSVAKDYELMSQAIFDANREVYLKHFNPSGSRIVRWKYALAFGLWKRVALLRAKVREHRKVRPV
jgi:GT2 family glycosyltransferase